MHIQMFFGVLKTRLASGVSIGFNKKLFCQSVVDVAIRKRSNDLLCVESAAHKTSEILLEILVSSWAFEMNSQKLKVLGGYHSQLKRNYPVIQWTQM